MTAAGLVATLLENDEFNPETFDVKGFVTKRPRPQKIEIWGKRWFRRGPGGTYFRVYVYVDDHLVYRSELDSGYGDYYLERGTQWLEDEGYIPKRPQGKNGGHAPGWQWIRDELKIPFTYHATDVPRQRDT
jgi:hypothetical protein